MREPMQGSEPADRGAKRFSLGFFFLGAKLAFHLFGAELGDPTQDILQFTDGTENTGSCCPGARNYSGRTGAVKHCFELRSFQEMDDRGTQRQCCQCRRVSPYSHCGRSPPLPAALTSWIATSWAAPCGAGSAGGPRRPCSGSASSSSAAPSTAPAPGSGTSCSDASADTRSALSSHRGPPPPLSRQTAPVSR